VLATLLDALQTNSWSEARFERIRQSYLEDIDNAKREFPFRQLLGVLSASVEGGWLAEEQRDTLVAVSLSEFATWAEQVRQQWLPRLLVSGNFTRQQALDFARQVAERYPYRGPAGQFAIGRLADQPQTSHYWVPGNNQAALLYLPAASDSVAARAINLLAAEWLANPFYTELRTQRQLGYVVAAVPRNFYRLPGIAMLVQSPDYALDEITAAVDEFVAAQPARAGELSEAVLEQLKASVIGRVTEQPKNLAELNGRFFESLNYAQTQFDFRQQVAAAVGAVTLDDLQVAVARLASQRQRWWLLAGPALPEEGNSSVRPLTAKPFSYPMQGLGGS